MMKAEEPRWKKIADFLNERLPYDIPYDELAPLCQGFYVHTEGIPDDLLPVLNKENIAEAFAWFVRKHFDEHYGSLLAAGFGANFHKPTDKGHWLEVIASVVKMTDAFDLDRETAIRRRYLANK